MSANVDRIRVLVRRSQEQQDGSWSTVEAEHEVLRPSGVTVEDAVANEREILARAIGESSISVAPRQTEQTVDSSPPKQAPTAISQAELDQIPFKNMPSKPEGYWTFSDAPEAQKLVALCQQRTDRTIVISQQKFTLSKDGKFLNRWPHKGS